MDSYKRLQLTVAAIISIGTASIFGVGHYNTQVQNTYQHVTYSAQEGFLQTPSTEPSRPDTMQTTSIDSLVSGHNR